VLKNLIFTFGQIGFLQKGLQKKTKRLIFQSVYIKNIHKKRPLYTPKHPALSFFKDFLRKTTKGKFTLNH